MKTKKSQAGVDFLIAIGIIVFFFTLVLSVTHELNKTKEKTSRDLDKRAECLKFSDLISYTYSNGPGTQVKTNSKYLVSVLGLERYIYVMDLDNVNIKIAALASEESPTLYDFYTGLNENLEDFGGIDWYKNCNVAGEPCRTSSFPAGAGCPAYDFDTISQRALTDEQWDSITMNLNDLMNNINNYNLIFLDDPKISYTNFDTTYREILEDWVADGNFLIITGDLSDTRMLPTMETPYTAFGVQFNPRFDDFCNIYESVYKEEDTCDWVNLGHTDDEQESQTNRISIVKDDDYFKNLKREDTFETLQSSFVKKNNTAPINYIGDVQTCDSLGNCAFNDNVWFTTRLLTNTEDRDCENKQNIPIVADCNFFTSCEYAITAADNPLFSYGKQQNVGSTDTRRVDIYMDLIFDLRDLHITGSDIRKINLKLGGCWSRSNNLGDIVDCNGGEVAAASLYNNTYERPGFEHGSGGGKFEIQIYKNDPAPSYEKLICNNVPDNWIKIENPLDYGAVGTPNYIEVKENGKLNPCNSDDTISLGYYDQDPTWGKVRKYHEFSFVKNGGFDNSYLDSNSRLIIRFNITGLSKGKSDSPDRDIYHHLDYAHLDIETRSGATSFTEVGVYNMSGPHYYAWIGPVSTIPGVQANRNSAIAYWGYGQGKVFYISDSIISTRFLDIVVPQSDYTDSLIELVRKIYLSLIQQKDSSACTFIGKSEDTDLTGNILIKNENGEVILQPNE